MEQHHEPEKHDRSVTRIGGLTPMPLDRLCREAGLAIPRNAANVCVTGIASDSRAVRAGELFVALRGLRVDAREYIADAIRHGAVAVVTEGDVPEGMQTMPIVATKKTNGNKENEPDVSGENARHRAEDVPVLYVENARIALARLFDAWYGHPGRRLRLIGITGTNGKTTVACLLRHLLEGAGIPTALVGTIGCALPGESLRVGHTPAPGMTTPDPAALYAYLAKVADTAAPGTTPTVVMEVTSHALALGKVAPLLFDTAIFTNLSPEHLDLHGTMEDYYAAKRRLFEVARRVVVNADDRYGRMLLAEAVPVHHWYICHAKGLDGVPPDRMCPYGEGSCTRVYAEQVKSRGEEGVSFRLTSPDVRLRLTCPLPGGHTVMNALEAAAAALALGVPAATVREGIAAFPGVPGRMERVVAPAAAHPFSVYIDFAHTPDALEKLLLSARELRRRERRIVLLFGCGGDRDPSKRSVMARIASRMADSVIVTSDNSRGEEPGKIIADILRGLDKESEFAVIPDRAEAIRYAIRYAREGDIILLAGKGHEAYEIDRTGMHPFSEAAIVHEALAERLGTANVDAQAMPPKGMPHTDPAETDGLAEKTDPKV